MSSWDSDSDDFMSDPGPDGPEPPHEPPDETPFDWFDGMDDETKLVSFIAVLQDDLHVAVALRERLFVSPRQAEDELLYRLHREMASAWSEAQEQIPLLMERILAGEFRGGLDGAGLTGNQLDFKLFAWHRARERLLAAFEDSADRRPALSESDRPDPPDGVWHPFRRLTAKRPRWLKRGLRRLSKALSYADTILDSLASVVSMAEPLKEFKQTVEKLAGDTSEWLPDGPT